MATPKKEAPMAAVGSYDCVLPFQAIGIETAVISADNRDTLPQTISRYARDGYAAVFVEEMLYADYMQALDEINEREALCVIPIPSQSGSQGIGIDSIRKSAERAVGMDIFNVN